MPLRTRAIPSLSLLLSCCLLMASTPRPAAAQGKLDAQYEATLAGIPVGREISADDPYVGTSFSNDDHGSIIVVVATDAPLVAHQLKRLARRVSLGLGRNGSISGNGSGDIFIAFSTANPGAAAADHVVDLKMLPNDKLDPVFAATVQATEEAIINAMIAAETMTGIENHRVRALPHDHLRAILKKYNRLAQ